MQIELTTTATTRLSEVQPGTVIGFGKHFYIKTEDPACLGNVINIQTGGVGFLDSNVSVDVYPKARLVLGTKL